MPVYKKILVLAKFQYHTNVPLSVCDRHTEMVSSSTKKGGLADSETLNIPYSPCFPYVASQLRALGHSSNNDVLGFDCRLLCMCSDLIAPIITKFANASIHTKCFVSDWKLSRVTPIYKGNGDANDKGNYRPISIIGHIAIMIEHEITNQVVTYLESNKILTTDQSAYRAQHNTQAALHKVVDDWLYNITDGFHTTVCSFDIRKCFDTINHSILCKKMETFGFHEDDIDLFSSYLSNRKPIVKIMS